MNQQGMSAVASTINFANIIKSLESNINLLNLILLFKNNHHLNIRKGTLSSHEERPSPTTIEIETDGKILVDGKPFEPENPPEGMQIFIDKKSSSGEKII